MSLGQTIRKRRCQLKLTQEELAGANLTKSFISQLERNLTNTSFTNLKILASRLHMTVTDLVASDDPLLHAETACAFACGYLLAGQLAPAQRWTDQAQRIMEEIPQDHPLIGQLYYIRGHIALMQGKEAEALTLLDECLTWARELNQHLLLCQCLLALGKLRYQQRLFLKAARFLEEARETFFTHLQEAEPALGVEILAYLIRINEDLGDHEEAAQLAARQRMLLDQAADLTNSAIYHLTQAERLHQAQEYLAAQHHLHKALTMLQLSALPAGNIQD